MAEQEQRIAARLRQLRAETGHKTRPGQPQPIEEAVAQADVRYRQWQRWEKGETLPHSKNLEKVAAAYGRDVSYFYINDEPAPESQLDKIERKLDEVLALFTGTGPGSLAGVVAEVVDRLTAADESPPPPALDRPPTPPEDEQRKTA